MKRVTLGLFAVLLSLGASNAAFSKSADVVPMYDPDNPYAPLGWRWPTTSYTITGEYGEYRSDGRHKGIDIGVKLKPVYAVADGQVVGVGTYTSPRIKYVTIKHDDKDPNGNNLITRYLHLNDYYVSKYDYVSRGEEIAESGNTGAPGEEDGRGYHLHFDVNNGNDTTPDYSDTINPKYFWPNQFRSLMADESEHSDHIEIDFKYDNPEYFIDQILIDYVGEDKFNQWMDENNPEDRTLTNFKKHFNVTDKDIEKLNKEAKEKAEKKNKKKKSINK
ncbi:M23 family metallopeptidase [Brevibacillus thermoruber]|uniref:M23 family metallopeptidase n=1 Tax=Brevibacillus thermoruber TaxID=33942 RepID=UPI004042E69A